MTEQYVLDRVKVRNLLNRASSAASTSTTEEQLHPWYSSCFSSFNLPLMRLWDSKSGSQLDEKKRMNSRAPRERLDTTTSRERSLAIHINHANWTHTPYISFTSSPTAIEELAEWRQPKRGCQTLTVIHPNTRLRNGLPILDFAAEMKHYNVRNPYGGQNKYCKDHYICLWQVTEKEIIGHWNWDELVESGNWYEDIIMPAFREFSKYSDLSVIMDKLCCKSHSPPFCAVANKASG